MITLTPEQRHEIEKAGEAPLKIQDPDTKTAYLIIREDVYRKLQELVIDHADESCFEFGEFYPDK